MVTTRENNIYCDTNWLIDIAKDLRNSIENLPEDEYYEWMIDNAYTEICEKYNITKKGLEKIHEICIKVKYDISRLKYVTLLKEEIYNRPVLTCPYRTETIVFHSDRKNYMLPSHGVNKLINYDVSKVVFKPCIRAECAMYDLATGTCRARI